MEYEYEIVKMEEGLPIKTSIHSIDGFHKHWHKEMEFLLVLKGSVYVTVGDKTNCLKENDLVLINYNEPHSTKKTDEKNILLIVQVDSSFYDNSFKDFNRMRFDCKSYEFDESEQERFDFIRYYIAKIIWELNKRDLGYQMKVRAYVNLLGEHLLGNYNYTLIDEGEYKLKYEDYSRLQRVLDYINKNFSKKITLKEVAKEENLNYYYLSHFIKDKLGMSFQEYINSVRLDNAVKMILNTNENMIDISNSNGFSSTNSFNKVFRERYLCTPTEYRKKHKDELGYSNVSDRNKSTQIKTYLDVDRTEAFKKLFSYIDILENKINKLDTYKKDKENICADTNKVGEKLIQYWKNLITFGRAKEGLGGNWKSQIKGVQEEIPFKYIRFHGIFNDEMMIYNISTDGSIEYNWSYVDELFDLLLSVNIKPFIELGFMPSELKRSDETIFWWKGNISPPNDINNWNDLIRNFIIHCINRYGLNEVEDWYFEVWNEPEYEYVFWAGSKEEYFEFYKQTVFTIKSISSKLRVGGPSITYGSRLGSSWLDDFLIFCKDSNISLDFLSTHIYPEYIPEDVIEKSISEYKCGVELSEIMSGLNRVYHDRNHTLNTINLLKEKVNKILGSELEIHITEWNASSLFGNLIHDTCYVATYIIRNILQCIGTVDSLGYWTFTDIFEEHKLGISHFHGGFGLINKDGLKKPSYYAYYLLSKLGDKIIAKGEEYIITKKGESVQILVYNYAYFDDLFLAGDTSLLFHKDRYSIYETKKRVEKEVNLEGIVGDYKIIRYKLNRENGSVFDEWIKMGSPENMNKEEIMYLSGKSKPKITVSYDKFEGNYKKILSVPVHGVEMIVLEKLIK